MAKLRRALDLVSATSYGIGIIIGAGIYVLIGVAAGLTGASLWLSFLVAAVVATFTGLSYSELASMYPRSAAEYVYIKKAYRNDFYAFILGWLIIFTGIVSASAASLGFSSYFSPLFNAPFILSAAGLIVFLSLVNYIGIREASKFNLILVAVTIFGLIFVISAGVPSFGNSNLLDFSKGFSGLFAASAIIFFAYLGFEEIVNVAEETRNPRRILPKALTLAIGISTLLYILVSISSVSLVDAETLAKSDAPLAEAVQKSFLGNTGGLMISIIALFATISTVLGILVVTSRMIWGMAREKALPKILARVHPITKTPWIAIMIVGVLSIAFLSLGNLETVASITSVGALIIFVNINLAVIWLRYAKPNMKRTFRSPLNIGKYPLLASLGVFTSLFMIFQFETNIILFGILIAVTGAFFYILRKQKIIPV